MELVSTESSCASLSHSLKTLVSLDAIYQAPDLASLCTLSQCVPLLLQQFVAARFSAYPVAHTISAIGEAISCRLLQLGEAQFGLPPIPYAFVVAGSMARQEQTAHSDQDNGLLLHDAYQEAEHGEYFLSLANWVSDGLAQCGYLYCPGNIMATNPAWRMTLSAWREQFRQWIEVPRPEALLNASIFFDLRCLYGTHDLFEALQQEMLRRAASNSQFKAFMAGNALRFQPPFGFFKNIVQERLGDGRRVVNLKKHGIAPVTDLARVYALASGSPILNTYDRLSQLSQHKDRMEAARLTDLREAFDFISTLRLRNQAKQIAQGKEPDHYIELEQVSSLEQRYLRYAFKAIIEAQGCLAKRYQADYFGG
ncbi:DUF294 nucleotidyltransferase-like domain-containing protein [Thiolinea disciformis]|uniref:DUF294 nucleotidyltransferase-like domain-containing protein n=1 Tax=Thiolinea disciformis TaxID=125614 RepID=UPI00037FDB43|nr:DUF294 nucleotidyltransferase-like domain-containing protein [Thiolinea disciformis]